MIPAPFDYVAADSAAARHRAARRSHGDDAKLLAGGHSLLPMMKLRLAAPEVLIDIGRAGRAGRDRGRRRRAGDRRGHPARRPGRRPSWSGPTRRCWPTPPRWSATRRSGTAARSAGRWRTPTRPPTCRWRWSRWAARSSCSARRDAARWPPTTSSPASSRPAWNPASCSPPSGCRAGRARRWGYQKFIRRANDWAIVGRGGHRRPDRAGQHGPGAAAGPRRRAGAGRRGQRRPRRPSWPPKAPRRVRTCTPTASTVSTWRAS